VVPKLLGHSNVAMTARTYDWTDALSFAHSLDSAPVREVPRVGAAYNLGVPRLVPIQVRAFPVAR
jgi:hypothetical protein